MKSISNIIIISFITILISACNNPPLTHLENENIFSNIEFYNIDSFDLRISNFLSQFDSSDYFVLIDYNTCARCSEAKIDNFFSDLSPSQKMSIIFNDSSIYFNFRKSFPNIKWEFVENKYWEEIGIQSSIVLEYKKVNYQKYKRLK